MLFSLILFLSLLIGSKAPATPQQWEYLCPTMEIICPENQDRRKKITFTVRLGSADPSVKPKYVWRVTAGKIVAGQGTPIITVDASKVKKGKIKATLKLGGFPSTCAVVASCSVALTKP